MSHLLDLIEKAKKLEIDDIVDQVTTERLIVMSTICQVSLWLDGTVTIQGIDTNLKRIKSKEDLGEFECAIEAAEKWIGGAR